MLTGIAKATWWALSVHQSSYWDSALDVASWRREKEVRFLPPETLYQAEETVHLMSGVTAVQKMSQEEPSTAKKGERWRPRPELCLWGSASVQGEIRYRWHSERQRGWEHFMFWETGFCVARSRSWKMKQEKQGLNCEESPFMLRNDVMKAMGTVE